MTDTKNTDPIATPRSIIDRLLPQKPTAVIEGLSFGMKLTIRDLWSASKVGYVHAAGIDLGMMRPLLRRGLVVSNTPLGFTLTPLGVEVVDALEAEWTDHVEDEFGDVSYAGRMTQGNKSRALISMGVRRANYIKDAEKHVARLERQLTSAKIQVELLTIEPVFNQEAS